MISRERLLTEFRAILIFLKEFLKNPLEGVRHLPSWDWPTLVIFHLSVSGITGFLGGIVEKSLMKAILALIIIPIYSVVMVLIGAGFLYYTSLFVFKIELHFKALVTLILLSYLPAMILNIVSPVLPPATLLGLATTLLLLIVGLVDSFGLPRKPVIKLMAAVFALFFIFWVFNTIRTTRINSPSSTSVPEENIKILEKEFGE